MVADTYFADLRVRGLQKIEARTRVASSILSYADGLATGALGAHPVAVAVFKPVSGIVRLALAWLLPLKVYRSRLLAKPGWNAW